MTTVKYKVQAQRFFPLCLCLCGSFVLMGAGVPAFAQSNNETNNRLSRLEKEIDTLNRAVYKGQKPPPAPDIGSESGVGAAFEQRISQMESDVRTLTGKVEQQSYDIQQLQSQIEILKQQAQAQMDERNKQATLAPSNDPAMMPPQPMPQENMQGAIGEEQAVPSMLKPDPAQEDNGNITGKETGQMDAASLYEQGFGEIKASNYDAAAKSFGAFLKNYPTHALAPNALYWLGETYYVRKDYDKASRTFAEAYQKYPDGPKAADNLLKLGMSLAAKGESQNACVALGQLQKQYPNGPAPVLKKGEEVMSSLSCP